MDTSVSDGVQLGRINSSGEVLKWGDSLLVPISCDMHSWLFKKMFHCQLLMEFHFGTSTSLFLVTRKCHHKATQREFGSQEP